MWSDVIRCDQMWSDVIRCDQMGHTTLKIRCDHHGIKTSPSSQCAIIATRVLIMLDLKVYLSHLLRGLCVQTRYVFLKKNMLKTAEQENRQTESRSTINCYRGQHSEYFFSCIVCRHLIIQCPVQPIIAIWRNVSNIAIDICKSSCRNHFVVCLTGRGWGGLKLLG